MMRSRLTIFALCLLVLTATVVPASAQDAPPNDNFEDAQELVLNAKYKVTNVHLATSEADEPSGSAFCAGASFTYSVWYKFTAPADAVISISTTGSYITAPFGNYPGTLVAVYTGPSLVALTEEACATGIPEFVVTGGITYYIRIMIGSLDIGPESYYKVRTSLVFAAPFPPLDDFSFENSSDAWVVKKADNGDDRVCGIGEALFGSCAFKFVGGADEATKLQQKITWPTGVRGKRDHAVVAYGLINSADAPDISLKMSIVVTYADGTPKSKGTTTLATSSPDYASSYVTAFLTGSSVANVKLVFKHKSPGGLALLDDVVMYYVGGFAREAGAVLPVPAAAQ